MKLVICGTLVAIIWTALFLALRGAAPVLAAGAPVLTITIQGTAPRQVEDTTQRAVPRDYSAAWQSLAEALDENRADLLAANFVGQRRTNCATRSVSNKRRDCVPACISPSERR